MTLRSAAILLRTSWWTLRNRWLGGSKGAVVARSLGALGALLFWWLIFAATRSGVVFVVELLPQLPWVVVKLTEILFLVLISATAYSSVLVALGQVYLADDLRLIAQLPISNRALFITKWLEVGVSSAWAPAVFGAAALGGIGSAMNVPWSYYPTMVLVLVTCATLAPSVAMAITTVAVNVFPANRTRDVLVFLSLVLLLGLFIVVRSMNPERLAQVEALSALGEELLAVELPGGENTPWAWATAVLSPWLNPQGAPAPLRSALSLGAVAVVAWGVAGMTFLLAFRRGLSTILTSRARLLGADTLSARLIHWATGMLPRGMATMAQKDLLAFGRDPSQWSQLLLLGALVAIYLINVQAFPVNDMSGIGLSPGAAADLIGFVNLAFVGFVLTAVSLRFLFTAVSLEGKSMWIPLSTPLGMRTFLLSKLVVGTVLLAAFAALLVGGSLVVLKPSLAIAGVATLGTLLEVVGLGSIGLCLGALMPSFNAATPARIVATLGGLLHMICGLVYVLVQVTLLAYPAYRLRSWSMGETMATWQWMLVLGGLTLAGGLAVVVAVAAFGVGERAVVPRDS